MSLTLTRVLLAGNRQGQARLAGIAAGIAAGVTLFLLLWGAYGGLEARDLRGAWSSIAYQPGSEDAPEPAAGAGQTLGVERLDRFGEHEITRLDVSGPADPVSFIPGQEGIPAPGTYFASPALQELISGSAELGPRFGTFAGLLPNAALPSPDSLTAVVGASEEQLLGYRGMESVIVERAPVAFGGSPVYSLIAVIGGFAILIPVLLLVGIVTDLGAAARRERFAMLRLIGATPARLRRIAATEMLIASAVGTVAGVLLAWVLRPLAARIEVGPGSFFTEDLSVSVAPTVGIALITVVSSVAVAVWRTRRANIGPLATDVTAAERRPRPWSLIPLLLGMLLMVGVSSLAIAGFGNYAMGQLILPGFILTLVGLLLAGPYLTYLLSSLLARRASSAAGVIALSRIARGPRATFRTVSGLVIAVFLVSMFSLAMTTRENLPRAEAGTQRLDLSTLSVSPPYGLGSRNTEQVATLADMPGVEYAVPVYFDEGSGGWLLTRADARTAGLDVPGGAPTDTVRVNEGYVNNWDGRVSEAEGAEIGDAEVHLVLIGTDGTPEGIEAARTSAWLAFPQDPFGPITVSERWTDTSMSYIAQFEGLANLGILVATLISTVSLAVATVASVLDRRRALGLLRLMGMPLGSLRRIILGETALPLLAVFGGAIGLGFISAWAVVVGLTDGRRSLGWPAPGFYLVLALCLALAALAVIATFRTVRTATGLAAVREE